jgi:hypothetical protein
MGYAPSLSTVRPDLRAGHNGLFEGPARSHA